MTVYRYIKQNDLSVGVMVIEGGLVRFVPPCPGNKQWDEFQSWLAQSPFNQPQDSWYQEK